MDEDKFSTGGFNEVPMGEKQELPMWWEHSTKEDVLASLASLAASNSRMASATEKQARYTKVIASSLRRAVDERKVTNRALWQIVSELKQIKRK